MNRPYRDAEVGSIAPAPGFQVVQSHGRSLSKDIDDSSAPGRDHDGDGARSDWDLLGYLMQIAESWTMLSRGKAVRSRRPVPGVDGGERNRRWNTGSGVGGAPVAKVTVTEEVHAWRGGIWWKYARGSQGRKASYGRYSWGRGKPELKPDLRWSAVRSQIPPTCASPDILEFAVAGCKQPNVHLSAGCGQNGMVHPPLHPSTPSAESRHGTSRVAGDAAGRHSDTRQIGHTGGRIRCCGGLCNRKLRSVVAATPAAMPPGQITI